jgi:diguanylate cyclase (GGDEF)-like protein/PAS domain S-box-containing protein
MRKIIYRLPIDPRNINQTVEYTNSVLVVIGILSTLITLILIILSIVLPKNLFPNLLLMVPVFCIPVGLCIWFKWYISAFFKKVEKEALLKRLALKRVNYLESIIQNSNDIILTVDSDAFILKFNKGAQFHFGSSQEEVLGKPLSMLFVNERRINSIISRAYQTGNFINEEISIRTKSGEIRQLNLSAAIMNYDNINLNGLVVTAKDITEMKQLEIELRRKNEQLGLLAISDSLTGLYNVRHFYDQIKRELKRFSRNPERKLSLILLDIDRFKELNDTEGHQMGDHVLSALAQVIKVCIREDIDTGYRYGGDEFVIVLPDTDQKQARVVAERIQKQFGAFKFGNTGLSIGITEAMMVDNEETIVKRADEAMYTAKKSGKGCIACK